MFVKNNGCLEMSPFLFKRYYGLENISYFPDNFMADAYMSTCLVYHQKNERLQNSSKCLDIILN